MTARQGQRGPALEETAVTAKEFRRIALAMPEAVEASHMGHPDFRVAKKIFATSRRSGSRIAVRRESAGAIC
jgi:hypothetical protein